jgi:hypothetical protein
MEFDKKYLAGYFDNNGSVGIYFPSKKYRYATTLKVSFSHSRTEFYEKLFGSLKERYGGNIQNATLYPSGTDEYKCNSVLMQLQDGAAEMFLKDVAEYVINKKDQVNLALHWFKNKRCRTRHDPPFTKEEVKYIENMAKLVKICKTKSLNSIRIRKDGIGNFARSIKLER